MLGINKNKRITLWPKRHTMTSRKMTIRRAKVIALKTIGRKCLEKRLESYRYHVTMWRYNPIRFRPGWIFRDAWLVTWISTNKTLAITSRDGRAAIITKAHNLGPHSLTVALGLTLMSSKTCTGFESTVFTFEQHQYLGIVHCILRAVELKSVSVPRRVVLLETTPIFWQFD